MEENDVVLYKPGKCNIGPVNRLLRFSYGFFFLSLSAYLWLGFSANGYNPIFKAMLILPLYVGFLGIYQAVSRFCVYHARRRSYDMR